MDQDDVDIRARDALRTKVSTSDYEYARQLVSTYFVMLMTGCQRRDCTNVNCRSNAQTSTLLTATEAAIKSIYFATQAPVPLCGAYHQEKDLDLMQEQVQAHEKDQTNDMKQPNCHEELPETSESELLKIELESGTNQSITTMPVFERKSTPRQRLSVAMQLDNGLNKTSNLPATRSTVITRVVVQTKHKLVMDSAMADNAASTVSVTTPLDKLTPEQAQIVTKVQSTVKDVRERHISRPKEKLFDAIKRSFSRSKKTPSSLSS